VKERELYMYCIGEVDDEGGCGPYDDDGENY
jgi:hypothetical protein